MKKNNIEVTLPNGKVVQSQPKLSVMVTERGAQPNGRTRRNRRRRELRRIERTEVGMIDAMMNTKLSLKGANTTRDGKTPNPADPRSAIALAQLGTTISGRMAVLKILHPNGEGDEYVTKFPDGCANTSIVMERRDEFKIEAPPEAITATENWNVLVISPPFLFETTVCIRWAASDTPDANEINSIVVDALSRPGEPTRQYPTWQSVVVGSTTFGITVLAATALTPNYRNSVIGIAADIKSLRRTYMGLTIDLDAADLYRQGRVVAGQWKPDVAIGTASVVTSADPVITETYSVYQMQVPADLTNTIVQSDELVYQGEAKCGLYMPCRPSDMDPEMTPAQEYRPVLAQAPSSSTQPAIVAADVATPARDLWLKGWLIGVSLWTDIDYRSTLRVKRKEGIEFISAPAGPFAPFATEALPADLRAQQMLQEFSRKQPHGFPADYNSLGTLLQKIVGGIGDAVHSLGIPVLSDVAGGASSLVRGGLGNQLAGLLDSIV